MKKIQVRLGERAYPIVIGRRLFRELPALLKRQNVSQKNALIVTQDAVAENRLPVITKVLNSAGIGTSLFLANTKKSSEEAKSQQTFTSLLEKMASCDGKNKSLFLIALGGGVVGDLTGFAASVYRRGVPFVQIPTTVTAQVDSAIGGKTGIDLPQGKNLLGTIYQPAFVLSDTQTLETLPDRHWSDGFAEVIKYGVIGDSSLFSILEKNTLASLRKNHALLEHVIARCAQMKANVVEKDETDKKNIRIILNFGHTAGHAIEAASEFSNQYTHGEAVSIGMLVACSIAEELGVLKDPLLGQRLEKLLVRYGLPIYFKGLSSANIMHAMGYDKKTEAGKNRFVLPVKMAKTTIQKNVSTDLVLRALEKRKA